MAVCLRSLGGTHRYGAKSSAANSQVVGGGVLQWHVDGAFYRACTACAPMPSKQHLGFALALTAVAHLPNACAEKLPPAVTALHCVEAPSSPPQTFSFDDAAPLNFKAGATAYVSAAAAFVRLLASFARHRQTLMCTSASSVL